MLCAFDTYLIVDVTVEVILYPKRVVFPRGPLPLNIENVG